MRALPLVAPKPTVCGPGEDDLRCRLALAVVNAEPRPGSGDRQLLPCRAERAIGTSSRMPGALTPPST